MINTQLGKLETELFAQTIEKCRDLLGRNGFKSGDIEKVVLIGGPTLSPRLRKMIEEGLGIPIDFSEDPLTAVACGAAIYAAGRKIPDDPLKKIREIEGSVIEAAVHGNLRYPSTTREEEVMVAGRLEPKDKSLTISSEWSVEIKRINKAGEVEWSGGRISVADNGGFSKVVQLEKGENLFRLVVINAQGREVKSDRADFTVIKTEVEAAPPHLPRGIGVADKYGDVIWFFEKGKPLPAEKSIVLATTKKLIRGEKGEAISIPVVEGNEKKAHLNREIYKLKVEADKVLTNIPEGSSVEVTIQIDESRSIEVEAFLEDYDVEASATNPSMLDIKPEQLHDDLKKLQQVISSLTDVASEDREVNHVVEEVNKSGLIDDIEKLISQISKENPEPAQQAMDKILKLRKKLDPVIEKGNELIKWKPHREWCDKNIRTAKNIVREVGDLPSDWQGQFDHLLSDYADAVREKDFRRTEELAYGTLPDLFLSSEALRERVGGSGLQKPETPGIYDGGGLKKGDVKR
jgi:molecular chaperone DnaK